MNELSMENRNKNFCGFKCAWTVRISNAEFPYKYHFITCLMIILLCAFSLFKIYHVPIFDAAQHRISVLLYR